MPNTTYVIHREGSIRHIWKLYWSKKNRILCIHSVSANVKIFYFSVASQQVYEKIWINKNRRFIP